MFAPCRHATAAGTKKLLELWFNKQPFPEEDYIVREGWLAPQYR